MGGLEPARDYVLRAMAAGPPRRDAPTSSCSATTARSCGRPRASTGSQLRFEAAVAGVVPVIRVLQESLAGAHVERIHGIVNGTTNFILTQMAETGAAYAEALAEAQRLGYAEADPTDDVNGRDAAAKMAILARLAFNTPVHARRGPLRGHRAPDRRRHGLRARARPRAQAASGTAERVDGGLSRARAPGVPLRAATRWPASAGPFNAVTIESDGDHRDHAVGPGRGRAADGQRRARRRHQRDDPARLDAAGDRAARDRRRRRVGLLPAPRGRRPPRRAGAGRPAARACRARRSSRVVQQGLGDERAARDGHPPDPRVALLRRRRADRARWTSCARARARSASSTSSSAERDARADRALPRPPAVRARTTRSSACTRARRRSCPRRGCREQVGAEVWLKLEGANPTGSFKDRGMTCAVSAAVREGAEAVVCASTGNTAASARRLRGARRACAAR